MTRPRRHGAATSSRNAANSSARVRRGTAAAANRPRAASRPACRPARSARAGRAPTPMPSTSSGATTTPAPVSRSSSAAAPSGGTTARIGRSAARYSKTLPGQHALAAAARVGDQQQQRLGVPLELERLAPGRVRQEPEAVAEAELLGPDPVGRAEVAEEARLDVEPGLARARSGTACGSRLPKKLPACVIRKRSPRRYSSRRSRRSRSRSRSSTTGPLGRSARVSSAIASETATIPSAERATSRATSSEVRSFARTSRLSARRCGCATSESRRSATQRTPVTRLARAPIRCTEAGGEVVTTTSIALAVDQPDRRRGSPSAFQVTFSSGTSSRRPSARARTSSRRRPVTPCSSSASLRPLGPR